MRNRLCQNARPTESSRGAVETAIGSAKGDRERTWDVSVYTDLAKFNQWEAPQKPSRGEAPIADRKR